MTKLTGIPFSLLFLLFLTGILPPCFTETLRGKAEIHFGMLDWADLSDSVPSVEITGATLPGGVETFPVMSATDNPNLPSIYPEAERLGLLDYAGLPAGLEDFLRNAADELAQKNLPAGMYNPERPFVPVIAGFQLEKLPALSGAFFSRPLEQEDGSWSCILRLTCRSQQPQPWLYAYLAVRKSGTSWCIDELKFDGETYAHFARQN
jgi:hypothetical protein